MAILSNCTINGTTDYSQSTSLIGIASYGAAGGLFNIYENNTVINCAIDFQSADNTADVFSRNTSYNNASQYAGITRMPPVNTTATTGNPASNLEIP